MQFLRLHHFFSVQHHIKYIIYYIENISTQQQLGFIKRDHLTVNKKIDKHMNELKHPQKPYSIIW